MAERTRRCRYCLTVNPARNRKCGACKKALPKRRRPSHLVALKLPYEDYVALNGGDHCAIVTCQRKPSPTRRLDRDHDHTTGKPRGLLCVRHNRMLDSRTSPAELRACADYLERARVNADPTRQARTPAEILATGAAWVTETELEWLAALAARVETMREALREVGDLAFGWCRPMDDSERVDALHQWWIEREHLLSLPFRVGSGDQGREA